MHVPTASRYQDGLCCKDMRVRFELQGDSMSWMWRTTSDSGSGQACKANVRELLWNTMSDEIKTATCNKVERERASYIMS
jgi:hypothetical protein